MTQAKILHFFDEHYFAWRHQKWVVGVSERCKSRPWTVLHATTESLVKEMFK